MFSKVESVYRNDTDRKWWLPLRYYTAAKLSDYKWWRNYANFWLSFLVLLGAAYSLNILNLYHPTTPLVPLFASLTLAIIIAVLIRILKLRELWWGVPPESEQA